MNPFELFENWYKEELAQTDVRIPSACCLSTVGLDGYPNARFVSLKEILEEKFVITGPLDSRKGLEIQQSEKVALTFWWTKTERQVRIQGNAKRISDELADKYFSGRPRETQIVSMVSEQGKILDNVELLHYQFEEKEKFFRGSNISRPENWGGFAIEPQRIELLEFRLTRFHERRLFDLRRGKWSVKYLQP